MINCAVCGRPLIDGNKVLYLDYQTFSGIDYRGYEFTRRACTLPCAMAYCVGLGSKNWKKPKG